MSRVDGPRGRCRRGADDAARAAQDGRAYLGQFPNDFASEEVRALLKEIGAN